jgi:hypothetical protein
MTGTFRNPVHVLGINAATFGVVTGLRNNGTEPAVGQAKVHYLSFTRHLSTYPDADMDPAMQPADPEPGAAPAAKRAGQSGCSAGVLHGRCSARFVGQAIRFGWPGFVGARAAVFGNYPSKVITAKAGPTLSGHSRIPPMHALPAGILSPALSGKQRLGRSLVSASVGVFGSAAGGN